MKPKDRQSPVEMIPPLTLLQALIVPPDQMEPEQIKEALSMLQTKYASLLPDGVIRHILHDPLVLEETELIRISGYKLPKLQCDYFNQRGIPASLNGVNRCSVYRKYFQLANGAEVVPRRPLVLGGTSAGAHKFTKK